MLLGAIVALAGDAAGEAQLATGARGAKLVATAHVDFRIIIPPSLGLTVGTASHAAVESNGRSVTVTGRGATSVLTAAAHGVITRDTPCGLVPVRGAPGAAAGITDLSRHVMVCTAATP